MASLARLGSLTDELVAVITSLSNSDGKFNFYRESSLRALRHHSYLRTNHFEVENQLNGLEERLRIQDREAAADALRGRLDALEAHSTKWTPEILHLLLELSDQPTQNFRLRDLDELAKPDQHPERILTWAEIAKEDGWDDDQALWRRVDFAGSSDDEGYDDADAASETSTRSDDPSVSSVDSAQQAAQALVLEPEIRDVDPLQRIEDGQAWRHALPQRSWDGRVRKIAVSDYQLLREALFMLRGLRTTLFDARCKPVLGSYQLAGVSWDSFKALITSFAECGRRLLPLRSFAAQSQHIPLLQVFRDAVATSLGAFDRRLSEMQARLVVPGGDVVVSLMGAHREVKALLSPLYALSDIIRQLEEEQYAHPFRYLELLFDATGVAQLGGDDAVYRHLGTVFLDCFQVYLRPIRLWMEDGTVVPGDRSFFVSQSATKTPLTQLWRGQFKLRQTQAGVLHAPRFLQPAVKRIFTTGKSINVLRHLGRYELAREQWTGAEPLLDFASVCGPADDADTDAVGLAPFSELFGHAFDLWVRSKHHTTSATLRRVLFESCGLARALDSLQHVYLGSDGAAADAFAAPLFRHLDALSPAWRDRFTLSEMAHEAFDASCADAPYRLSATVDARQAAHSATAARASVRAALPAVRIAYRLPWPVQLIIPESSLAGYHDVFTLLLQLRRAEHVLRRRWVQHRGPVVAALPGSSSSSSHRLYLLVRAKLVWFCDTLATYLATLVLAPAAATLREGLAAAVDVDDMIAVHAAFIARATEEACLGSRLAPLRGAILDVFDLAVRLDDAHADELAKGGPDDDDYDKEEGSDSEDQEELSLGGGGGPLHRGNGVVGGYLEVLKRTHTDYEKHLRFVAGGLRGVARATRSPAAGKWDVLAEMLEVGIDDHKG